MGDLGAPLVAAAAHALATGVAARTVVLVEGVSDQLLVDALDLTQVPRPLDRLLAHLSSVDGP